MKFYDTKHVGRWSEGKQLFIKQADNSKKALLLITNSPIYKQQPLTKLNKQVVAAMKKMFP